LKGILKALAIGISSKCAILAAKNVIARPEIVASFEQGQR
jgi:hypothetical protein